MEVRKEIYQLIKATQNKLTIIDSNRIFKLKSKHSIKMLMLLEWISGFDTPRKLYDLDELNLLFETKYKYYNDFMKYVLKVAKDELDNNSKLSFEYEDKRELTATKRGRPRIVGIWIYPKGEKSYQPKLKGLL